MASSLVVREFGCPTAPIVLLLHGLTESGGTWPDSVERWRDRWHLLAVDLRGHGDSPRFSDAQLRDAPGVLLADVLPALDMVPAAVAVVGHSLGALLALRAAAMHDRIRGLVLEDSARPSGAGAPDSDFVRQQEAFLDLMIDPAAEIARMQMSRHGVRRKSERGPRARPLPAPSGRGVAVPSVGPSRNPRST